MYLYTLIRLLICINILTCLNYSLIMFVWIQGVTHLNKLQLVIRINIVLVAFKLCLTRQAL
jgi:hypothetical protein